MTTLKSYQCDAAVNEQINQIYILKSKKNISISEDVF